MNAIAMAPAPAAPSFVKERPETIFCPIAGQKLPPATLRSAYHYTGGDVSDGAQPLLGREHSGGTCTVSCRNQCTG